MSFLFNASKKAIVLLFLTFGLNMGQVFACDCSRQNVERGFNSASIILEGQIVSGEPAFKNEDGSSSTIAYEVEVLNCLKGDLVEERVTLYSAIHSAACGYFFEESKTYLIYADFIPPIPDNSGVMETGNYSVSACSRTTSAVDYERDNIERLLSNAKEKERMREVFLNESIFVDTFLAVEKSMRKQFRKAMRD